MVVAVSAGWAAVWWLGLGLVVFGVIPLVLFLASGIIVALREVLAYTADIRDHGAGLARSLDAVGELDRTRAFARDVGAGSERLATGLAAALDRGRRS